ncbi:hydrolase 2, exosortase A system-associated [Thauera phenylacetica]
MALPAREAFFLEAPLGGRFCLFTRAQGTGRGTILHVPAFAEEQNKSRRMVALAALAFAARGWSVLQLDLFGCGDSAGELVDASWSQWVEDVGRGHAFLSARSSGPVVLWANRAGSLLAADWLQLAGARLPLLLWQPVTNGRQHLSQFLRVKAASEMLSDADAKTALARARAALHAGEVVEVAGYELSPELANGMEASSFELPATGGCAVAMLEVDGSGRTAPSPALAALRARLEAEGATVSLERVAGPAFWQTQEIELAPELIERSCHVLEVLGR